MSSLENFRNRMAAYGLLGILLTSVGCSPYKRLFNGRARNFVEYDASQFHVLHLI